MPSLTGRALLPKPTIAPVQIEQTLTGVIVAPVRGRIPNWQRGQVHGPTSESAMVGGKFVKQGKDSATDREIGYVDGFQNIRHGGGRSVARPLVAAAHPPDLFDRAKHLLGSANVATGAGGCARSCSTAGRHSWWFDGR
jgi:hypothetical protein